MNRPKKKKTIICIKTDEREMVFQAVEFYAPNGQLRGQFYVARNFGTRQIWVESKVCRPEILEKAIFENAARGADANGQIIHLILVDWILDQLDPDPKTVQFLTSLEDVFNKDAVGKPIYPCGK